MAVRVGIQVIVIAVIWLVEIVAKSIRIPKRIGKMEKQNLIITQLMIMQ